MNRIVATVTYMLDGRTYKTSNSVIGGKVQVADYPVAPTKTNYAFEGWYDAETDGTK